MTKKEIENKITEIIDSIRPYLNMDGGDIEFIKYDDIFEAIESGNDNGLEAMIKQIIEDFEEEEEDEE